VSATSQQDDIHILWQAHWQAALPDVPHGLRGELFVLDDILGGCVAFYLNGGTLDQSRRAILEDYQADLRRLVPDLDPAAAAYFIRLERLAELLLVASSHADESVGEPER